MFKSDINLMNASENALDFLAQPPEFELGQNI